ncbi:MAG TPA: DegV family protein [Dehalococcoidales bacterium]|nr:DegV family protein [Dehalococcoidales bacterium]
MPVKVVTDSVADLPSQVAEELEITVIPLNVRFGEKVYRDGIDLTTERFYQELTSSKVMPVTSVPSPLTFTTAYDKLAEETDEILAIMLSSKLSATHEVAVQSIGLMKRSCRVEVIDSGWAVMAQGFLVMAAARAALAGAKLDELMEIVRANIPRVDMRAAFDTLEYLRRGGRIGAAQALLGAALKIHPIITMKNGLVEPAGRSRSRARAIEHLYQFAAGYNRIEEMAVEEAACPEDADLLVERLGNLFPRERIYRTKTTPVIGTHTGPGLLLVAVMGDK